MNKISDLGEGNCIIITNYNGNGRFNLKILPHSEVDFSYCLSWVNENIRVDNLDITKDILIHDPEKKMKILEKFVEKIIPRNLEIGETKCKKNKREYYFILASKRSI